MVRADGTFYLMFFFNHGLKPMVTIFSGPMALLKFQTPVS